MRIDVGKWRQGFWPLVFGSVALHALVLWTASQVPGAPALPAERTIEVQLAPAAIPTVAPTMEPKALPQPAIAKTRAVDKAPVVVPTVAPIAVPTIAPIPTPIVTIPPPRERVTPVIAPTAIAQTVPTVAPPARVAATPIANKLPPSSSVAPTPIATTVSKSTGSGIGEDSGKGSGKGSGEGAGEGSGKGSGKGAGEGQGEGSGKGTGNGSGDGSGEGEGNGSGKGAGNGSGNGNGNGAGNGDGSGGKGGGGGGGGGGGKGGAGPFGVGGGGQGARRIVYVLDVSPSMETRIDRAQDELRAALAGLVKGESFGIVAFDAKAYEFDKRLLPATAANIARANKFLNDLKLDVKDGISNGTNLQLALRKALQAKDVNVVVVITDGEPTVGETNVKTIAGKARSQNKYKARIDAIGLVGTNPDGSTETFGAGRLLEQIARDSGGEYKAVKDAR